jgi:DNA-binding PucR family transcriptional regulator
VGTGSSARQPNRSADIVRDLARLVQPAEAHTGRIASSAGTDASIDGSLLGEYLQNVLSAAQARRRLTRADLQGCRGSGEQAAAAGSSLASLLDLYLSATWRLWQEISSRSETTTPEILGAAAEVMFRAADDAVAALAQGYETAQRQAIRREEALRREFVDDLLGGRGGEAFDERAARFGFNLAGAHIAVVCRTDRSLADAGPIHARVESHVLARFGGRDVVVATKDGLLACIFPGTSVDPAIELGRVLEDSGEGPWQLGVGRPYPELGGVVRSYDEAREALGLAARLGVFDPVVPLASLLPYRILVRDEMASAEMVEKILGPLRSARGGPEHLIETMEAYFAESTNVSSTARRLHVSPRTVTYRLQRVAKLTGYSPREPEHRFVLEIALRAARILGSS